MLPESELQEAYFIDFNQEYRKLTKADIATLIEDAQTSIVKCNEDGEYDIEEMRNLVIDRILNNPIYGDAVARGFLLLDEEMSGEITAQNSWLSTFISETDSAMIVQIYIKKECENGSSRHMEKFLPETVMMNMQDTYADF